MKRGFRIGLLVTGLFLLQACATRTPVESIHLGDCKELITTHYIYAPNSAPIYFGEHMINAEQLMRDQGVFSKARYKGELSPGTRVRIDSVILNETAGWGSYLRMTVKVLDGPHAGLVADVPMCAPFHSPIKWIARCTLDPNEIEFNPDLVRPCRN